MSKKRELLERWVKITVFPDYYPLREETVTFLAQPEQEGVYQKLLRIEDGIEVEILPSELWQDGYETGRKDPPTREPLSDEHLISAAPELLEALENWINALDNPSEWMKCRDDAKKAVEKAHGITGVVDE